TGCKRFDTSGINDNGEWVSIYDAPISCNYILYNDSVYGICFEDIDSINWDTFWNDSNFYPIDFIDVKTLFININDNQCNYAKDAKYVYCPTCYWCHDAEVALPFSQTFHGNIIIPGADPKTFKYLGDGYAVDKNGMYSCGEKIVWDDSIVAHYNNHPSPNTN
ncbi:MAG: DKNYY domain-containing protein, partial [Muribaculaceae bacterium]|nr:DKNYY domain-containing protein [Muribaculaceae bacterium]